MNDKHMTILSRIATWWRGRCRHDWHPLPTAAFDAGLGRCGTTMMMTTLDAGNSPRRLRLPGAFTENDMTARQIIEARLGKPLGPIATMPKDLRQALYLLARQLQKYRGTK